MKFSCRPARDLQLPKFILLCGALWCLSATLAHASFHLMQIEQVVGGVNGDKSAQAIQLRMRADGQKYLHSDDGGPFGPAALVVYDAQGANPVTLISFPNDVANGVTGDRVLVVTSNFTGHLAPSLSADFIMTAIPASYVPAGRLDYVDGKGDVLWSLSYGGAAYTGPTVPSTFNGSFGAPFAGGLPSEGTSALQFQGPATAPGTATATDYKVTGPAAAFANNAGATSALAIPPVITSPTTASAQVGSPFLYEILARNNPASFSASGLRDGLSLNPSTGVISGKPGTAGTVRLVLHATNSAGTGSANLAISVLTNATPVITSASSAPATVGGPFSYQITATNNPSSYSATGLRDGLTLDAATGVIHGTPGTAGTVHLTIQATNSFGTGSAILTINVASAAPVIISSTTAAARVGTPFSYTIQARNAPTSYSATGLRDGLTLNTATGVISGTPGTAGTVRLTISATNSTGTGSEPLTVTVAAK